jgi:hypothetical protein
VLDKGAVEQERLRVEDKAEERACRSEQSRRELLGLLRQDGEEEFWVFVMAEVESHMECTLAKAENGGKAKVQRAEEGAREGELE